MLSRVEKHSTNNLSNYILNYTSKTSVIKQMTRRIKRICKHIIKQPADFRFLYKSSIRFKQLNTTKDTTLLILPATATCEQLLKHQCLGANILFCPSQITEFVQYTKYCRSQD